MDEQRTFDDGMAAAAAAHRTLCVVEADTLTLFAASGAIFVVSIPSALHRRKYGTLTTTLPQTL